MNVSRRSAEIFRSMVKFSRDLLIKMIRSEIVRFRWPIFDMMHKNLQNFCFRIFLQGLHWFGFLEKSTLGLLRMKGLLSKSFCTWGLFFCRSTKRGSWGPKIASPNNRWTTLQFPSYSQWHKWAWWCDHLLKRGGNLLNALFNHRRKERRIFSGRILAYFGHKIG